MFHFSVSEMHDFDLAQLLKYDAIGANCHLLVE
jgi:hypothetical protein